MLDRYNTLPQQDQLRGLQGSFAPTTNRPLMPRFGRSEVYTTPPYAGEPEVQVPTSSLPAPPPSVAGKKPTIWDKEHISETLANIGQAFLSNQNFGEGLGAAAGAIGNGMRGLRQERVKSVEYGGPDDMFEITTDPATGERSVREVPEFSKAVKEGREARTAVRGKDAVNFRSNALYGIAQMPPAEREAAYQTLLASGSLYGVDTAGLPPGWDDSLGAIAGGVGMSMKDWLKNQRDDKAVSARISQGQQRNDAARQRLARMAPPGVRKPQGYYTPTTRADFDAMPSGAKFKAPDGTLRIKP